MSENQNRRIGDLSKYDAMTTEELEEILRSDAQAPEEQESDTEMILYVMEVLAARKRNNGHTGKTALEAYESFKQNYMPEVDNIETTSKPSTKTKITFPRWHSNCQSLRYGYMGSCGEMDPGDLPFWRVGKF